MAAAKLRLVGREAELSAITTALAVASEHRPSIVLVEGEPGIGKTRLVDEAYCRCSSTRDHRAFWGRMSFVGPGSSLRAGGFCATWSPPVACRGPTSPLWAISADRRELVFEQILASHDWTKLECPAPRRTRGLALGRHVDVGATQLSVSDDGR